MIAIIATAIACFIVGGILSYILFRYVLKSKYDNVLKEAETEAEVIKKNKLLEVKEKFLNKKADLEKEVALRNQKIQQAENKLKQREMVLSQRQEEIQRKKLEAEAVKENLEAQLVIVDKKKEELDGYYIDDDVIEYIAKNVTSNIRELEGSLNKIMAFANLENCEINLALAEKVLKDIISPDEETRVVTPEIIIRTVAEHFDLSANDLIGNKRSSQITYPRQIAMYLCRQMTDITLKIIGDKLGGRDHSTIMNGIKRIEKEVQYSEETREVINILKKKINPAKNSLK